MKHIRLTTILALLTIFSCTRKECLSLENSVQALEACKEQLNSLRKVEHASINQVVILTRSWIELKDSVCSCLARDTTDNTAMKQHFLSLSDSIRNELVRIAGLEARTMQDMIDFKIKTADRQSTEYYQEAIEFYEMMDLMQVYPDVKTTIEEYTALMNEASINDLDELKTFLMREDLCFRSLMNYLNQVPRQTLDHLTARTEELFSRACFADVNPDQLAVYLTIRLNRRVLQNAQTCSEAIKNNDSLTVEQCESYHYTLLQPFVVLNRNTIAVLTPRQENQLRLLAEELPGLLAQMDKKGGSRLVIENRLNVLATMIMKSYITSTI